MSALDDARSEADALRVERSLLAKEHAAELAKLESIIEAYVDGYPKLEKRLGRVTTLNEELVAALEWALPLVRRHHPRSQSENIRKAMVVLARAGGNRSPESDNAAAKEISNG